jgi:hypothetical protein
MPSYFSQIPTIPYETFDGSGKYKVVVNAFTRVRATLQARTDATIYYNYTVQDKETPEIISYKYYDSPEYHWIILLMNQVQDPQWDWPLDQRSFDRFIVNKYGSVEYATTEPHHYETLELVAPEYVSALDISRGDVLVPAGLWVEDGWSYDYAGLSQSFEGSNAYKDVSIFDYEADLNEKRRQIVLLRRNLLYEFVDEFVELVQGTGR